MATTTKHFGPLLVTSFLQNRGNQFTLGVFTASFIYCLLVLQTVSNRVDAEPGFVPRFALFTAL